MARNYAALPYDYLEEMAALNDAEFGRLTRALLVTIYDMDSAEKIVRALILNDYVVTVQAVKKSFPYGGISHFEVQFETREALKDGKGDKAD